MPQRPATETLIELPSAEPTSRRERRQAAVYLATATVLVALVVLAVVFDQFAATGVLLVVFLSFFLAYLIAPAAERLRYAVAPARRARPISRGFAVIIIYGLIAMGALPVWTFNRERLGAALERMAVLVPEHTARFITQVHESERWHESLGLPMAVNQPLRGLTRSVIGSVEAEARELGGELAGIKRLIPWLSLVPVVSFVLLTRWHRFRRSTTRALPTPHLQWRGNELLRNWNTLLAAYTRAQALSSVIIGTICWIGFAIIGADYPGTLGLAAGFLEMVPLAGPLVLAVVATATAPEHVVPILVFLVCLRVLSDYVIYPRLISRALHLHPLAVVLALWLGAALGGVVGVCLAVPAVGMMRVTYRHWREYRDINSLVSHRQEAIEIMAAHESPYVNFNFQVSFGPGEFFGGFEELSGLGPDTNAAEHREGEPPPPVTLRRGLVNVKAISEWSDEILRSGPRARRDVSVVLPKEDHKHVAQAWKLKGARIVRPAPHASDPKKTDIVVEELILAFDRIEVA